MGKLQIGLMSDSHNRHAEFDAGSGDILLHSGDCTGRGTPDEIMRFLEWYAQQDYGYLIMIPGNHDWGLERDYEFWKKKAFDMGIIMLNDSGFEADGVKIWGSPVQPWFHSWAFNRARTLEQAQHMQIPWIKNHWDLIPNDTEILITHGPAYGILDEVTMVNGDSYKPPQHVGCEELLHKIKQTPSIALHVSGHIHEGRGVKQVDNCTYVNASSLDRMYSPVGKRVVDLEDGRKKGHSIIKATREILPDNSILYTVDEN